MNFFFTRICIEKSLELPSEQAQQLAFTLAETFKKLSTESTSPKEFFQLANNFITLYKTKSKEYTSKISRYSTGLSKLNEASQQVNTLQQSASAQRVELDLKEKEANEALTKISAAMSDASEQRSLMQQLQAQITEEESKIEERQAVINQELSHVQPVIDQAKEAVGTIQPKHLQEISVLRAPPGVIRDILEAVLSLLGVYDTSWQSMKTILRKRNFREDITNLDARDISDEARRTVKAKISQCKTSFEPEQAKRASIAAEPLAVWCKAQLKYAEALDQIAPLEQESNLLKRNLSKIQARQHKLQEELSVHDEKIASLQCFYKILSQCIFFPQNLKLF